MIKPRKMRWAGHVESMGQERNAYRVLVVKPHGKRSLGISRRGREENAKIYLNERGWDVMDWLHLAQDRDQWRALVSTVMKLRAP
jgi:hypothetical protein